MPPILLRIVFLLLIPIGIFLLIKGIRLVRKSVGGAVLLNIPLTQTEAGFTVPKAGNYAVWQKGPIVGRKPVNMPKPILFNEGTSKGVYLQYPGVDVYTNNGRRGSVLVFTFYADAGQYQYQLSADPAVSNTWLEKVNTDKKRNIASFSLQIKESRPTIWIVLGILVILFFAFCIIGGLVFSINFNAFFAH